MTVGPNEIVSTRLFSAPRQLVFRAWTTPELIARWWGPQGFTNTFHECDITPGGTWLYTMHGPNGVDYPNHSVFVEIVPLERVVLDHLSGHHFRVTATFEGLEGRNDACNLHASFLCSLLIIDLIPSNRSIHFQIFQIAKAAYQRCTIRFNHPNFPIYIYPEIIPPNGLRFEFAGQALGGIQRKII